MAGFELTWEEEIFQRICDAMAFRKLRPEFIWIPDDKAQGVS